MSVLSTAPVIGTPKCASIISGVFGEHRRDRVAGADAATARAPTRAGASARSVSRPGVAAVAVDDRDALRPDVRGAREERQRRQRRVVGGVAVEIAVVTDVMLRSSCESGRWPRCAILANRCDCPRAACRPPPIWLRSLHLFTSTRRGAPMGHRLSKIVTRTGDAGTTGLGDGSRVAKDSPRIDGDRRRRRAQLDARRRCSPKPLPAPVARVPDGRPARPVRPGRRTVDSRRTRRSATPTSRGSRTRRRALQRRTRRRSRSSSCPAARAPPRSRTSRAPSAAAPSGRWSRLAATEAVTEPCADLPEPAVGPAVRARARAEPRRRARPTCCGARIALIAWPSPRPSDKNARLAALLSRVALGDQAAFGELYELTSAHLYGVRAAYPEGPACRGGNPAGGLRQRLAPRGLVRGRQEPAAAPGSRRSCATGAWTSCAGGNSTR